METQSMPFDIDPNETQNLAVIITELNAKIEVLIERQGEVADNVAKIKEAIYNPDQGLYARLRELEAWKQTHSRLQWLIITSLVVLTTSAFWNMLVSS
tara:strand:- start:597 stop:890 length:294 start_codon:yes stop_codon:yes gene_type:complete